MEKELKLLAINGSPRVHGNTSTLIDAVIEGGRQENILSEKVNLALLNINPCIACYKCKRNGGCLHQDDFQPLIEKIKSSDIIVFGTPVYWWGPTAQFKTFFDRFHGISSSGFLKDKYILLVIPFESKNKKTSAPTIEMIKNSVEYLGVKGFQSFPVPGVVNKGDAAELNDVIMNAKKIGKSLKGKLNGAESEKQSRETEIWIWESMLKQRL
ncbi:flavodoxin family protein [Bacteroidota bacterium]